MDEATTLDAFESAVDGMELGAFNFVAADANTITYRSSPSVPDRGEPGSFPRPWVLVDGEDPGAAWSGELLPLERLPRSRLERGWIGTANNDPFGFTGDGFVEGDEWYYGVWFDPGTRAARIEAELTRLTERGDVTLDEMLALQLDTYSVPAELFLPWLFDAADARAGDPELAAIAGPELDPLIDSLRTWDRRMDRESAEAVVFQAWVHFFMRDAIGDELGLLLDALLDASPIYTMKFAYVAARDHEALVAEGIDVIALNALVSTDAWLRERFGDGEYRWSDVHGTRFRTNRLPSSFDVDWFPSDGADGTIDVAAGTFMQEGELLERVESSGGAIYRMVARFDEDGVPDAWVAFGHGQTAEPTSPLWNATMEDWAEGRYTELAFTREEIDARVVEQYVLDHEGLR